MPNMNKIKLVVLRILPLIKQKEVSTIIMERYFLFNSLLITNIDNE